MEKEKKERVGEWMHPWTMRPIAWARGNESSRVHGFKWAFWVISIPDGFQNTHPSYFHPVSKVTSVGGIPRWNCLFRSMFHPHSAEIDWSHMKHKERLRNLSRLKGKERHMKTKYNKWLWTRSFGYKHIIGWHLNRIWELYGIDVRFPISVVIFWLS